MQASTHVDTRASADASAEALVPLSSFVKEGCKLLIEMLLKIKDKYHQQISDGDLYDIDFEEKVGIGFTYEYVLQHCPIYLILHCVSQVFKADYDEFVHNAYHTIERNSYTFVESFGPSITSARLYIVHNIAAALIFFKLRYVSVDYIYRLVYITILMNDCTIEDLMNAVYKAGSVAIPGLVTHCERLMPACVVTIHNMLDIVRKSFWNTHAAEFMPEYSSTKHYFYEYYFAHCDYSKVSISDVDLLEEIRRFASKCSYVVEQRVLQMYSLSRMCRMEFESLKDQDGNISMEETLSMFHSYEDSLIKLFHRVPGLLRTIYLFPTEMIDLLPNDWKSYYQIEHISEDTMNIMSEIWRIVAEIKTRGQVTTMIEIDCVELETI